MQGRMEKRSTWGVEVGFRADVQDDEPVLKHCYLVHAQEASVQNPLKFPGGGMLRHMLDFVLV
jgi:hypothetical protein